MTWASADHRRLVSEARQLAHAALADALPRRWRHTIGVAAAAERLASILAPQHTTEITCAAWLHDIGYAPAAVKTDFHPIDGAEYVTSHASTDLALRTTSLIAHHGGALFEAHERGLQIPRGFPCEAVELAILNAADLSTSPDGLSTAPAERLAEVLHRYPPEHPVHRAISVSQHVLLSQTQLVLCAAKTAAPHWNCGTPSAPAVAAITGPGQTPPGQPKAKHHRPDPQSSNHLVPRPVAPPARTPVHHTRKTRPTN